MEKKNGEISLIDDSIAEKFNGFEEEKEQRLVSLLAEIIISITLNELYEKGN